MSDSAKRFMLAPLSVTSMIVEEVATEQGFRMLSPYPDKGLARRHMSASDIIKHYPEHVVAHVAEVIVKGEDGTTLVCKSDGFLFDPKPELPDIRYNGIDVVDIEAKIEVWDPYKSKPLRSITKSAKFLPFVDYYDAGRIRHGLVSVKDHTEDQQTIRNMGLVVYQTQSYNFGASDENDREYVDLCDRVHFLSLAERKLSSEKLRYGPLSIAAAMGIFGIVDAEVKHYLESKAL